MNACDPGVNVRNLKRLVKQNTGLELNLTREQICDAYSSIQDGKLPLPPMVLSKDGKYMLDRKSPLTGNDFEILFGSDSTVAQLKRVARKAGLASYKDMTKAEMVEAIESILESKNIREPIRLHVSAQRATRKVSVNNNNNYPNNLNVNNVNGNGVRNNNNNNLAKIANESKNLNRNGNRNGNNLGKIANESRNLNRNRNRNGNRNGETRNGNRNGNARPATNQRTARYVNAMLRRPSNSRRNEDLAKVLAAARNTGNGSTQNLSRVIEALRKKPNTDGSTAAKLNKLLRAKTSGNSDALRRAMKEVEILKRRAPVAPVASVNNKQKKLTELEKYAVNKASKLGNQRLQFMNEAQKYIKAYKNGEYGSDSAKGRISARYKEIYNKRLNDMGFNKRVSELQEKTVNIIGNTKIKSKATELLEEYKKTGSQSVRNDIIKLEELDKQLGNRQEKVEALFNNRRYLNAMRDEVLKTKPYNLKNGLAKLDKIIEEKEKEIREKKREDNINNLIKNPKYEKLTQNEKNKARRAYMNGGSTLNVVRGALNKLVAENKNKDNINKLFFNNPNYRKLPLNTKNKIKEAYLSGKYTLNMVKKVLNNLVAGNTGNNNQPPMSLNNIFAGKLNNVPSLTNANRKKLNKEKNNIKTKLNNAEAKLKKVTESRNTIVKKTIELKKQLANGRLSKNEKTELEAKIKELTNAAEASKKAVANAQINRETALAQATENKKAAEAAKKAAEASNIKVKERNATIANLRQKLNQGGLPNNKKTELEAKIKELTNAAEASKKAVANAQRNREIALAQANENKKAAEAAKKAAEAAKAAAASAQKKVLNTENAHKLALGSLSEQKAKVESIKQQLEEKTKLTNAERATLQNQLFKERGAVAKAEQAARNAKSKANAALEQSRRLVAEAGKAAANASNRATEAERAKLNAQAERNAALGNKKEANRLKLEANRLKAEANAARKKAEIEAAQSRQAAFEANAEAKRIATELKNGKAKSKAEINALTKQMQKAFNARQRELQNQINAFEEYRVKANRRIEALETNRTRWQANANKKTNNLNLAKQRLAVKNANLVKKVDEIKRIQSNIARLQKEMNNTKTASNAEKAALKKQYNEETQKLREQLGKTETEVFSLNQELKNVKSNKTIIFKELQGRSNTLAETRKQLAQTQRELNNTKRIVNSLRTNLQKSKVTGKWQGAAVRGLGTTVRGLDTQLRSTQTNLNRAQKEIGIARDVVTGLRGQRNALGTELRNTQSNLQKALTNVGAKQFQIEGQQSTIGALQARNKVSRGVISGLQGQRNALGTQLRNTQNTLAFGQKQLGNAEVAIQKLRKNKTNLAKNKTNLKTRLVGTKWKGIVGNRKLNQTRSQRRNAQRGINTLRATTRNLEQRRLASNRVTNNTFNASAAFNQQLKSVAARQRWKSLKPKATMIGASQMGVGKALRQKLLKNIDVTNLNGKHVVDKGLLPGGERRNLKKEVQDPMTGLNRLRAIEKMILDRKTNRNSKILSRRRMNQIIARRGIAVNTPTRPVQTREQVTFRDFAASGGRPGLENTTRATGTTRSRTA